MRVVLLTSSGGWHRALAHRLTRVAGVTLTGIVVQHKQGTRSLRWVQKEFRRRPGYVIDKIVRATVLSGLQADIQREERVRFGREGQPLPWPDVLRAEVVDINGPEAVSAIRGFEPDLIAVSGTRIIKQPVFDLQPPRGLLNLHTGISPIYKGGPNCTLWCLANGEPEFIGSTLHVLDPGIDSGDIVASARVDVEVNDTAGTLACKAVAVGHDLYAQAVGALAAGARLRTIPQHQIGSGRTYFTRDWTAWSAAKAAWYVRSRRLRRWVESGCGGIERVPLVPLGVETRRPSDQ